MAASSSRVEAQAAEIAQLRAQLMEQLEGHRQLLQQMTVAQAQQQQQQQPQDQHEQKQLLLQQQPPSTVGAGAAAPAPTWTLNALGLPAELPALGCSRKRAAEDSVEAAMKEAEALVKEADEDDGGDSDSGKWERRARLLSKLVVRAGSHTTAAAAAAPPARSPDEGRQRVAGRAGPPQGRLAPRWCRPSA